MNYTSISINYCRHWAIAEFNGLMRSLVYRHMHVFCRYLNCLSVVKVIIFSLWSVIKL